MDNLWRALPDFPSKLFADGYPVPKVGARRVVYVNVAGAFSEEVKAWFTARDLQLRNGAILFSYVKPGLGTAHRDFDEIRKPMWGAINVELQGSSRLHFFEYEEANEVIYKDDVTYTKYDYTELRKVGTLEYPGTYKAYLVNVGLPHQAECIVSPRLLITLRFRTAESLSPTWEECVQYIFGNQAQ